MDPSNLAAQNGIPFSTLKVFVQNHRKVLLFRAARVAIKKSGRSEGPKSNTFQWFLLLFLKNAYPPMISALLACSWLPSRPLHPRKVIPYSVFGKSVSFLPHPPTFLRISINKNSSSVLGVSLTSALVHFKTYQKRPKVFHFIAPSTFVVQNEQPSQYFGMFCSKPQ